MQYPFKKNFRNIDRGWSLRQYWKHRLDQHHYERYKGLGLAKLPEDLRTYEHIIEATQPKVIVELGGGDGGSATWFADRLDIFCGGGRVVTVEKSRLIELDDPRLTFIHGDLTDLKVAEEVAYKVDGDVALVVEDSRHDLHTTLAALRLYSPLVKAGQFFIVEDAIIDEPDLTIFGDRGVKPAIEKFLEEDPRFTRRDFALYGVTMHMGGWLEAMS